MFELTSIFVPVDFSRGSRAAMAFARHLASPENARLQAVHVVPPMLRYWRSTLFPYAALGEDELAIMAELQVNALQQLQRALKLDDFSLGAAPAEGEEAHHHLDVVVADEVLGVAPRLLGRLSESSAELMVAGLHGEGEGSPGIAGSVAMRLAAESTRPVIFVRPVDRKRAVRKVLVALDMDTEGGRIYEVALAMAVRLGASLTVLTVIPDPLARDVTGVLGNTVEVKREAIAKRGRKETAKLMARFRSTIEVPFSRKAALDQTAIEDVVVVGDPELAILAHASENDVDLIVIGRRGEGRSRLPSNVGRATRTLLGCSPCLLMVVP